MKFSWKIFIISYCLMILSLSLGSFFMLDKIYRQDVSRIVKQAEEDNRNMYAYAATMDKMSTADDIESALQSLANTMTRDENNLVFVGSEKELFEITGDIKVSDNTLSSDIVTNEDGTFIQVVSHVDSAYIMNRYSLNEIIAARNENFGFYRSIVIILSTVMAIILFFFSKYISKPLGKLEKMAEQLSSGDYSVRVNADMRAMKSQEVKKLGETMNLMAENTDNNINELEQMIEKREEFIGDFTHEIKTPLTSIIGYGDLLRTYKHSEEKTREYGDYIYHEGKRLENLSLNLLQLIVMNNSALNFVSKSTAELFNQIEKSTEIMKQKYEVNISFVIEDAVINVEESLYITAIMNFIDNACKASDKLGKIYVTGKVVEDLYIITVKDEGRGIPNDELNKITEPFYMVDKSRTRSQGGAGIGLALCKRIAQLHNADMKIESVINQGTTVTFSVKKEATA